MRPHSAKILVGLLLVLAAPAHSEWIPDTAAGADTRWTVVTAPTSELVFIGGGVPSGIPTAPFTPLVLASDDGGHNFFDASGAIDDVSGQNPITALFFLDETFGWAAAGPSLFLTLDGGQEWTQVDVGVEVFAIHFFDELNGLTFGARGSIRATADGGNTWAIVPSNVDSDLRGTVWLNAEDGWAWGYNEHVDEDDGGVTLDGGVVLRSEDGGAHWLAVSTIDSGGIGPLFMQDDRNGWLVRFQRPDPTSNREVVDLVRTVDAGFSFRDLDFDPRVGTLTGGAEDVPLEASRILAMSWSGAKGHLSGIAFVGEEAGNRDRATAAYRVVDFDSANQGVTWTASDLGTIDVTGGLPPSDGLFHSGLLLGLSTGLMVGERGRVWRYRHDCSTNRDCTHDLECIEGVCGGPEPNTGGGDDDDGEDTGGSDRGPTAEDAASDTRGRPNTGEPDDEPEADTATAPPPADTGCSVTSGRPDAGLGGVLWLALMGAALSAPPSFRWGWSRRA